MKRFLSLILSLAIILSCIGMANFSVSAEAQYTMNLTVSNVKGKPGETVKVDVLISENPGIASLKFDIQYDSVLTLTDIEFNTSFGSMITAPTPYTNPQSITMISPLADITANGTFATLTFVIDENAEDNYTANITITFEEDDIYNGEYDPVGMIVTNGSVTVYHRILGDINGDNKVNTKDANELFRFVAGWPVEVGDAVLDVNYDGKVTTKDAIALFRHVAGWPGEIGPKPTHIHTITAVEYNASTCTESGNIAYWYCADCGKFFGEESAKTEIKLEDTVIDKTRHALSHVELKEATCTEKGNVEYWNCENCGKNFLDENAENATENVIIAKKGHSVEKVTEKAATCTENGNITYWHCVSCGGNFIDETAENKIDNTVITATGHALSYVEAKEATCTENGNVEYWYCDSCKCYFKNEEATEKFNNNEWIINALGHGENLKHVEKVDATVEKEGNIEYWHCEKCDKYYSDVNATCEITKAETILPTLPSYTVTFVDEKNDTRKSIKIAQNEDLLLDKTYNPQLIDGYTFVGWTDDLGTPVKNIPSGNTQNKFLYADWDAITYTITMRGLYDDVDPIEFTIEDSFELKNPTWQGLTFSHWEDKSGKLLAYTDSNGVSRVSLEKGTIGNIEIIARWFAPENLVVPKTKNQLSLSGKTDDNIYWFVYELGTIKNIVLEEGKIPVHHDGSTLMLETSKTITISESFAKTMSSTIGKSVVETTDWSNVKNWGEEMTATLGQTITTGISSSIGEEKVASVSASLEVGLSMELGASEQRSIQKQTGGGRNDGNEVTNEIGTTVSYDETISTEEKTSRTFTSSDPTGYYEYGHVGEITVYAFVVYNPENKTYSVDLYNRLSKTSIGNIYTPDTIDEEDFVNGNLTYTIDEELIENTISASYYIKYDKTTADGGEKMNMSVHPVGKSQPLNPCTYTKTGYTFAGWWTNSDFTGTRFSPEEAVKDLASAGETITLYAQWMPINYTVEYNGNGANDGETKPSTHTYDSKAPLSANGFKRKYTVGFNSMGGSTVSSQTVYYQFNGWAMDSKNYGDGENVLNLTDVNNKTLTMVAKWTPVSVTLPTPTRTGYNFKGWCSDENCTDPVYSSYTPETDVTLYAKWEAKPYTIVYHKNDGSGVTTKSTYHFFTDTTSALANNTFGATNTIGTATYEFLGWSINSGATIPDYKNGAEVGQLANSAEAASGTVNLYAVWLKICNVWNSGSRTITLEAGDYTEEKINPNFDITTLKQNEYKRLKVEVIFDAQVVYECPQRIIVYSKDTGEEFYGKDWSLSTGDWHERESFSFVAASDYFQTNGGVWIRWECVDGNFRDTWKLGTTIITVTAIK